MIDNQDKKLAVIESEQVYEPAIPIQDPRLNSIPTRRQLLWGYPFANPVRFSISSQQPVFVPNYGFVQHSTDTAEFVSTGD